MIMSHEAHLGIYWGLYWDNGKENGNYYLGFRVNFQRLKISTGTFKSLPMFIRLVDGPEATPLPNTGAHHLPVLGTVLNGENKQRVNEKLAA